MREGFIDIHTHNPDPHVISPKMAGIHPWDAEKNLPFPDFTDCDIIGETGLDYVVSVDRDVQESCFCAHLKAAQEIGKPVILHVVRAFEPVMKILSRYRIPGVVFHGFVGSKEQAKRCYDAGYYLSFGERSLASKKTREVISSAPAHCIFCETDDNPDCDIAEIYREVAVLRRTTIDELQKQIANNYHTLMRQK